MWQLMWQLMWRATMWFRPLRPLNRYQAIAVAFAVH
jgi:hypothetical protein